MKIKLKISRQLNESEWSRNYLFSWYIGIFGTKLVLENETPIF
jgi:hypothetical protein